MVTGNKNLETERSSWRLVCRKLWDAFREWLGVEFDANRAGVAGFVGCRALCEDSGGVGLAVVFAEGGCSDRVVVWRSRLCEDSSRAVRMIVIEAGRAGVAGLVGCSAL